MHGVDLFAKLLPVRLEENEKKPELVVAPEALNAVAEHLSKINALKKQKICVQFRSSNINRSFDPYKMLEIISMLSYDEDNHIFVIGGKRKKENEDGTIVAVPDCQLRFYQDEDKTPHERIHNLTGRTTWLETAALISLSDLVIGPDSAAIHLAGCLDIPCLGLYGPFPAEIRTRYYPSCSALEVSASCAPCFAHGPAPCSRMKEEDNGVAPCWQSINAKMVVREAEEILGYEPSALCPDE